MIIIAQFPLVALLKTFIMMMMMQWKLFFRVNHCYDMTDIASLEFSHASFLRVIFWCLNCASFNPIYDN